MNWEQAWLRYDRIDFTNIAYRRWKNPSIVVTGVGKAEDSREVGDTAANPGNTDLLLESAVTELRLALGEEETDTHNRYKTTNVILLNCVQTDSPETYHLSVREDRITLEGGPAGILYGTFALLRHMQMGEGLEDLDETSAPAMPLRMLNHWDNADGSIERGYSGSSFFFREGKLVVDERTGDYARLMASCGLNGTVINNVNVRGEAIRLILPENYEMLDFLGSILASYGVRLFLSVDFAAPIDVGGLDTADPCNPEVMAFWKETAQGLFGHVTNFGGFLVKADSEGRPGPFTYGRSHADGANMLADAVADFGGIIIWRCFVYNCQQDWRDRKTDRARAGYDHFAPLDGQFASNVILQIKNGPMDFQVREPVSPLFGAMPHTNQMLEVQAAQEYTGQQKDLCYLIPMFREVLSFETYCRPHEAGEAADITTVGAIVAGRTFGENRPEGVDWASSFGKLPRPAASGICAVANTGDDGNWCGHDLAAANWYGFGRLAWNPDLGAEAIAHEWAAMTFGAGSVEVTETVERLLMTSWPVYEMYTAPLGIGWMCNPGHHYGVNVEGYEYDRWGTYHRADCRGIGVDRTRQGTGYASQYFEPNASRYEHPETCPEELLLFFHHMPYDYVLKDGKTILQHIYDTHFEGVEAVEEMIGAWKKLEGKIDQSVYERVLARFDLQLANAVEWRDRINTYFYRNTLIPDEKGRTIYG